MEEMVEKHLVAIEKIGKIMLSQKESTTD